MPAPATSHPSQASAAAPRPHRPTQKSSQNEPTEPFPESPQLSCFNQLATSPAPPPIRPKTRANPPYPLASTARPALPRLNYPPTTAREGHEVEKHAQDKQVRRRVAWLPRLADPETTLR